MKNKLSLRPAIIVHCLVRNEERFIWYALNSVLPYVAEIMVWDTGSTDDTIKILQTINSPKISFRQLTSVDAFSHTQARQQMLEETDKKKYAWLMILDGDEIWTESAFAAVYQAMDDPRTNSIALHTTNFVSDIYHRLPESAGQYHIAGVHGHLNLRFIKLNLPDLHVTHPHGGQTYSSRGIALQQQQPPQIQVLDAAYFHATHLPRSRHDQSTLKRFFKRKYELGATIPKQDLPVILFVPRPDIVPDVTAPMSLITRLYSLIQTPLRRLRRRLLTLPSGYLHRQ